MAHDRHFEPCSYHPLYGAIDTIAGRCPCIFSRFQVQVVFLFSEVFPASAAGVAHLDHLSLRFHQHIIQYHWCQVLVSLKKAGGAGKSALSEPLYSSAPNVL